MSWVSASLSWWLFSESPSLSSPVELPVWPPPPPSLLPNEPPPALPVGPENHREIRDKPMNNRKFKQWHPRDNDKRTHPLLLLLLSLLGVCFGLLLRLFPCLFFLFEFLYSRVTAVRSICSEGNIYCWHVCICSPLIRHKIIKLVWCGPLSSLRLCLCLLIWSYRLVFVFCSSPLSSSELSKLGSVFQSTSSRLDCKTEQFHEVLESGLETPLHFSSDDNSPFSLFFFFFIQIGEFPPRVKIIPLRVECECGYQLDFLSTSSINIH